MGNHSKPPYITRFLQATLIRGNFLNNIKAETLAIVECKTHEWRAESLRLKYKDVANILIVEDTCSTQDIASKSAKFKKCHHFRLTNWDDLEWLSSKGDVDDLRKFSSDRTELTEEKHFFNHDYDSKINSLVGEPGIGKTTFMKRLTQEYLPSYWTVFFNRTDMMALYDKNENFEEYIIRKECPENDIYRKILQVLLANGQILCIWDGIDEIVPENVEYICELILQISKTNITQWVTSRTYLKTYLEERLGIFAKSLKTLSTSELISYAEESLAEKYSKEDFEKLFELMSSDIFKIPLHLFMLVEVLQRGDNCLKLSNRLLNVVDLYQHFIDGKFNIHFEEKADYPTKTRAMQDMRKTFKAATFKSLQEAAAYVLVPELNLSPDDFLQGIKEEGDSLGFIINVDHDNNPSFVHISYAEYLVATYWLANYKRLSNLKDIVFKERLTNIRFLFDLLLGKDSEAHVAFLQRNYEQLKRLDYSNSKDLGGRNVLHLAASWGYRYPEENVKYSNDIYTIEDRRYTLGYDLVPYREIIQDLVSRCDVSDKDEVFQMDPLEYAETCKCLLPKVKILVKQGKKFGTLDDDLSLAAFVFFELYDHQKDLLRLYKNFPMIHLKYKYASYDFRETMLQRAAYNMRERRKNHRI